MGKEGFVLRTDKEYFRLSGWSVFIYYLLVWAEVLGGGFLVLCAIALLTGESVWWLMALILAGMAAGLLIGFVVAVLESRRMGEPVRDLMKLGWTRGWRYWKHFPLP